MSKFLSVIQFAASGTLGVLLFKYMPLGVFFIAIVLYVIVLFAVVVDLTRSDR